MVVNIKEDLKYALLSVVLTFIHLLNVLVINPLQNISKLLTETPELTAKLLKHSYHGKNCVVTGGSSGIGKELAIQLSSLGANVIISSRSIEKLEDVAAQCRLLYPQTQIFPIILDLERYDNISEYTKTILQTLKENGLPQRIDVLINNAGLSSRGAAMDTSMQTLQKIMDTNFLGPVALTQSIAATMIAHGGGLIGVISSVQGKIGIPYRTSYAASKHALQGYFDGLRAELAEKNILVTTVSPGYVNTSLSLNALNPDGTKYNKTDETTAGGMNPDELSTILLKSMATGVADIVVADAKTRLGVQLKALIPQLFAIMMRKRVGK